MMGKKKERKSQLESQILAKIYGRKINFRDKDLFLRKQRSPACFYDQASNLIDVNKLDREQIRNSLASTCRTIEHQIITLRAITQLSRDEYQRRYLFTKEFLTCLRKHHGTIYQGILFGSTINGLGFKDSDVDLRLRPLKQVDTDVYEPVALDEDMVDRTLRDIAFQTTKCCPAIGEFVPSSRCPIAKLTFLNNIKNRHQINLKTVQEGLKFDVSLSPTNHLGTFNSMFFRFLCHLEPKFHLLATVLRYWSNVHDLIVPGYLSSYALVNMLIFFCQTIEPPLLPTLNKMRDLYFEHLPEGDESCDQNQEHGEELCKKGLTQIEWHCLVCLNKEFYTPSTNSEPLSVLLLKFFELYLNFPYSNHIITTRPGHAIDHDSFKTSNQFHPRFPINPLISIQDPFDLKHNLTSGMQGGHFRLIMITMRYSYERLFKELMNNFSLTASHYPPLNKSGVAAQRKANQSKKDEKKNSKDWGLNVLFLKLTEKELNDAV